MRCSVREIYAPNYHRKLSRPIVSSHVSAGLKTSDSVFQKHRNRRHLRRAQFEPMREDCRHSIWTAAARKLDQIDAAVALDDLRVTPGNRLKALRAERTGQHSIRISDQYRICFKWAESGAEAVEVVDYH